MSNAARQVELRKYEFAYQHSKYRMSPKRGNDARRDLENLPTRGSYLDVSCGRGEMLAFAEFIGYNTVQGTEIVPKLINPPRVVHAWAHALPFPDKHFETVSMLDVIEHLIPGDDQRACKELARVAICYILITANNQPSFNKRKEDLHINKRSYEEWDQLFRSWFSPHEVVWLKDDPQRQYVSEAWKINLGGAQCP